MIDGNANSERTGGKQQLHDELYSRFPKQFNHYHKLFFGGGALFLNMESETALLTTLTPLHEPLPSTEEPSSQSGGVPQDLQRP